MNSTAEMLNALSSQLLIVEHDPLLYEDSQEMVGRLTQTFKQTPREATVLLL